MTWYQNEPNREAQSAFDGDPVSGQQSNTAPTAGANTATQQPAAGFQQTMNTAQRPAQSYAEPEQAPLQQPAAVPAVDVVESADEIVVRVDVPGFEKDELELQADANRLYVSGNRTRELDDEHALLTERPTRVERTIPLSGDIDPEEVTASHENGVCEISVPKDAQNQRHEIGFQ